MSLQGVAQDRVELVARLFEKHFGRRPEVIARAPGRVNLIGEHAECNSLPVLSMAIDRCVLVAGARRDDRRVELVNAEPRFPSRSYRLRAGIRRFRAGDWGNHHKGAAQVLLSSFGPELLRGGQFLVEGDIPEGVGFSSSSALVIASALALVALNELTVPPRGLAELSATAEGYAGRRGSGVEHMICCLAQAGHALRVDFDPLRPRPVPLLPSHTFVLCDSLAGAEKSAAARAAFDSRATECRLACRVLEHLLGTSLPRPLAHFGDLRVLFPDRSPADFIAILEHALPPRPLHLGEIAEIVSIPRDHLATAVGGKRGRITYALLRRVRHVVTEAERVDQAEAALAAGDWLTLGGLMDASHASCRDDYGVSSPVLEALIAAAKESGALGARLTGTGCTLNLLPSDEVSLFLTMIERRYYQGNPLARQHEHCFVVAPSAGASAIRL